MRCHTTTMTRMESAQIAARHLHRLNPTVTRVEKIMLRHSSQRQGNCINCSFGQDLPATAALQTREKKQQHRCESNGPCEQHVPHVAMGFAPPLRRPAAGKEDYDLKRRDAGDEAIKRVVI